MRASAIYSGRIRHRRMRDRPTEFSYDLSMLYIDLDELPKLFDGTPLWSAVRPAPAWFRRSDYFGDPDVPLAEAVRDRVEDELGRRPDGPVRLLTHLRYFGVSFNPVSFYYCFDPAGERVQAVLAEVTNTPWLERHAYVVEPDPDTGEAGPTPKEHHVSPFMPMDLEHSWRLPTPGPRLFAHLEDHGPEGKVFDATLTLDRTELTPRSLNRYLLRYPLMTAKVVGGIYYEAAKLGLRGARFHGHPKELPAGAESSDRVLPSQEGVVDSPLAITSPPAPGSATPRQRAGRWLLLEILQRLRWGRVHLVEYGAPVGWFGPDGPDAPEATLRVHSPRFYGSLLDGSVGAGRSYIEGDWDSDDLVAILRLAARNMESWDGWRKRTGPIVRRARATSGWFQRNTPLRSRKRISHHYDLGNDFFELFLDSSMMYSCAVFEGEDTPLYEAQIAKLDRLCRKLDLRPTDHLLEIGTGWGGMAIHAAQNYGCRVTTTTISREQHRHAVERVAEAGLSDRVTVLLEDYRQLEGTYDKLVSIEMIEAVGHEYFDAYFRLCSRLLKPDGAMALQAITIVDRMYEEAKAKQDFIKAFIFPGGCIPSVGAMMESVGRATDMRLVHLEDISEHYVRTLHTWRENLYKNLGPIEALGYDRQFLRMWEMYLAYCEAGFAERRTGDVQLLLAKPRFTAEPLHALPNGEGYASKDEAGETREPDMRDRGARRVPAGSGAR